MDDKEVNEFHADDFFNRDLEAEDDETTNACCGNCDDHNQHNKEEWHLNHSKFEFDIEKKQ